MNPQSVNNAICCVNRENYGTRDTAEPKPIEDAKWITLTWLTTSWGAQTLRVQTSQHGDSSGPSLPVKPFGGERRSRKIIESFEQYFLRDIRQRTSSVSFGVR
ncbi:MAG: hypothetical protein Q9160_001506 [Pyrenula sp. 1 TL-2023]